MLGRYIECFDLPNPCFKIFPSSLSFGIEVERLNFKDGHKPPRTVEDRFYFDSQQLSKDISFYSRTIIPAGTYIGDYHHIRLTRHVMKEDIENLNMTVMPGFRAKWSYNSQEELAYDEYFDSEREAFIRLVNVLVNTNQSTDAVWRHVKLTRKKLLKFYLENPDNIDDCYNNIVKIRVIINS